MFFKVKAKCKHSENVAELIEAFCKDVESSNNEEDFSRNFINVNDNVVEISIYLDGKNYPANIVIELSNCEIITCFCGKEDSQAEDKKLSATKQKKSPKKTSEVKAKRGKAQGPPKSKKEKSEGDDKAVVQHIPEIHEIAKKSTSFEEFVKSVASWIGAVDEKQEFFKRVVYAATKVDKISWTNLQEMLGSSFNTYAKTICAKLVNEKLAKTAPEVSILKFIKILADYKTFEFTAHTDEASYLKEISENLNSGDSINKKIESVLTFMGYGQKEPEEQSLIFKFVETAFMLPKIDVGNIFDCIGIAIEERSKTEMILSTFINGFVRKYDPNNKVKVVDFIEELKSVIVLES